MYKMLDAIIFGATGYTDQVVVKDAVELLKEYEWGIAGRSKEKLLNLLKELGRELGRELNHVPIIVADVSDEFYGEVVVKACIQAGTHHVDISGEPQYIDGMQLKYHEWAKEKGVYIISTCAFESLPYEMGVVYAERNFQGTINSIEAYFESTINRPDRSSKAILNIGTWESAVYAVRNSRKLLNLQTIMNDQIKCPKIRPALHEKPYIQRPSFSRSYFIPFPSVDRSVVERSQRRLYEYEQKRPIQFKTYIGFRSLSMVIFIPIYTILLMILALMSCTYKLLIKYAEFFTFGRFTRKGPTAANREAQHFSIIFKAKGWSKSGRPLTKKPDKEQLTQVSGINPLYGFTSVALISAAKTILKEFNSMPGSGGVLPPGAAFYKTSLIEELCKHKYRLHFEVLKSINHKTSNL